jgi:hypothetical protein
MDETNQPLNAVTHQIKVARTPDLDGSNKQPKTNVIGLISTITKAFVRQH